MAKTPTNQEEIYASDLLSTQANALTLNGLTSDSFLRADITSNPWVDDDIKLGIEDKRFNEIWTWNINGYDADYIMYRNRTNVPTVNSDGEEGLDIGSFTAYWRAIYSRKVYVDDLYVGNIRKADGSIFSHKDLSDIGNYTHVNIDDHIDSIDAHQSTPENIAGRIVSRDASGNIYVGTMFGVANKALYADLAEKYSTNSTDFTEGTVFKLSDDPNYDVEICNDDLCENVIGVFSLSPAYLMNDGIEGVALGLKGKLKCRVIGKTRKGNVLVSTKNGCLRPIKNTTELVYKVAVANETSDVEGEKLIDCIL